MVYSCVCTYVTPTFPGFSEGQVGSNPGIIQGTIIIYLNTI